MGELAKILTNIREGDKEQFADLLERFEPLIKKYMKHLYKDESEDVRAELSCALWEAVLKMGYIELEGQIVNYLQRALFNRYLELYRGSKRQHEREIAVDDSEFFGLRYTDNDFDEVLVDDIKNWLLSNYSDSKREIYRLMIVEELSDSEISERCGSSRQYVNRLRRVLKKDFMERHLE